MLDAGLSVVLVDYSCPDACGDWAERHEPDAVQSGMLRVVRVQGKRSFHKTVAQNVGSALAVAVGCRYICFLDADTLVTAGFADWCRAHAAEGRFAIVEPGPDTGGLTGVLLVSSSDLLRLGGHDESFVGYGKEDIEIRLRYRLVGALEYDLVPNRLLDSIGHTDELRTRHYAIKDMRRSDRANFDRLRRCVREWTGKNLLELDRPDLTPLLGFYQPSEDARARGAQSTRGSRQRLPTRRALRLPPLQG